MKSISTKNVILLSIVLAALIFGGAFFMAKNKSKEVSNQVTPTPIAEVREEIKDGVYKNYTYGFSFEYDEEIFDQVQKYGEGLADNLSAPQASVTTIKGRENKSLFLDIIIYRFVEKDKQFPGYGPTLYFSAVDKAEGDPIMQYDYKNGKFVSVGTKIKDIKRGDSNIVLYTYKEMFEDNKIGSTYYSADWILNDKIISIRISTDTTTDLKNFHIDFGNMFESLQIIASDN